MGGDRNLGPGTIHGNDYGFSPANDLGNNVVIKGPVCWTLKMHSSGKIPGSGDVILGDGSAQQCTALGLPVFSNATHARLIFP